MVFDQKRMLQSVDWISSSSFYINSRVDVFYTYILFSEHTSQLTPFQGVFFSSSIFFVQMMSML